MFKNICEKKGEDLNNTLYYLCNIMETVTFKLQEKVLKKIDELIQPLNFNNRTEFIREAVREKLNKIETEKFMRRLAQFKGAAVKKITDEEFEANRLKAFEKLAQEFGVILKDAKN